MESNIDKPKDIPIINKPCDCNCQTTVNDLLQSQTSFEE
jgi:hypothetical protein